MPYKVVIRNNATGETRVHAEDSEWQEEKGYSTRFSWTEGNFCCDCNRELVFEWAAGNHDTDDMDGPCGHERFTIPYIELPDGRRVPIDEPAPIKR